MRISQTAKYLLCLVTVLLSYTLDAQRIKSDAQKAYSEARYSDVITILNSADGTKDNVDLVLLRGLAYTKLGLTDKSLSDLARARSLESDDPRLAMGLAETYHKSGRFKDAIRWYKTALQESPKMDEQAYNQVMNSITQCVNSELIGNNPEIIIEHAGDIVNTIQDETNPIFSRSAPGKLYFNRLTTFEASVEGVEFSDNEWKNRIYLPESINAKGDSELTDISGDGQVLFINNKQDKKYYSLYSKQSNTKYTFFYQAPYFPHLGDCDLQILDAQTMVFASLRPDSYGGYDIYICTYSNGKWSEPRNMGPSINSAANDRSPFMTADKKLLFYSSDRLNAIGGYDIYTSTKSAVKDIWRDAKNIGAPLSSPGNDLHFKIDATGLRGSLSSDRSGGNGGLDIYLVYFRAKISDQILDDSHLAFIKYEYPQSSPKAEDVPVKEKNDVVSTPIESKKVEEEKPEKTEIRKIEPEKIKDSLVEVTPVETVVDSEPKEISTKKTKTEITSTGASSRPEGIPIDTPSEREKKKQARKEAKQERENEKNQIDLESLERDVVPGVQVVESKGKDEKLKPNSVLYIPTLFYHTEDEMFSIENRNKLDSIAYILRNLPRDAKIELTNFTHPGARREYELFFGISKMKEIAQYLDDKGLKSDQIILNAVGSKYPLAEQNLGGSNRDEYLKKNQRIEACLYNVPETYSVEYNSLDVPSTYASRRYPLYKSVKDDLHFRVIFAETDRIYKNVALNYFDDIMVTMDSKWSNFTYSLGFTQTYSEAMQLQEQLTAKGIKGAEIVPYIGSIPLSKKEALLSSIDYPALKPYLESVN